MWIKIININILLKLKVKYGWRPQHIVECRLLNYVSCFFLHFFRALAASYVLYK